MVRFRYYRSKIRSTLVTWILLSSVLVTPLLILVQPTSSPTPWWNSDWYFRKLITLNHTLVKGELQNFPVLIDIVDNDLRDKAQLDGDDIVFIDNDNNTLSHEIEHYDSSSGHLTVWVKMPLLHSDTDTTFYMYYGNPDATNKQNSSAVWDHNFVMVQHMEESSGTLFDSTSHGNNGTLYGEVNRDPAGKIDGADTFNTNGYIRVPEGFLPNSSITIELWLKPSAYSPTTWTKFINTGPTTTSGIFGGQSSKTKDAWTLGLSWDSATKRFNTGSITSNYTWNYVAITWNGTYCVAYHNGKIVKEEVISGEPDWAGMPLYLGSNYRGGERFNGSLDEVRISNVTRPPEWIQTSYNNLENPSVFYTIGAEEFYSGSPFLCHENPPNGAIDVYTNPTLSIHVIDPNGQNMTIVFREKVFDTWKEIRSFNNVSDGTYSVIPANMKQLGTTYYWNVYVTDGENSTSKTFSFTTTTKVLEKKWVAPEIPRGISGVLIADINNDDKEEIIHAGEGEVVVLSGTDGSKIWNFSDSSIDWWTQPQMADLNHDGIPEIVVPLNYPAGLLILHANNGTLYWRRQDLGQETFSSPVIADIDGDGYPTIFTASSDIFRGLKGTGRLTALSYNGTILRQTFIWRPCAGGLSIADADGDGEFELYMSDRHMYMKDPEYGDNDYGKGVQSFWAKNLTLRWSHPDILCSSQIPMLADVTGDSVLDVIIGDLNGGLAVLNSTDGSIIRRFSGGLRVTPTHYQPSVYDIDGDGNLELLMADPHEDPNEPSGTDSSDDIVVWDLVNWKVDARIYIGKCFYGPQIADVTGDGIMEIVASNFRGILIIDRNYRVIDGISGLHGKLNYAVAQDIDGDGYTELVVSSQGGYIYAFDTPARTPEPKPRTEVQFYSEYRRGVAEYLPPPGCQEPVITSINPLNNAENVPLSLSQIQFTLIDYQRQKMNYTVTTNPDIGSQTETNVTNGRYTFNITEKLAPSTTYKWTVNITDGTNWTNITFTFTTEPLRPWWNVNWQYRKKIIIDHMKIYGELYDFPVLINIQNDSDLVNKSQPDAGDVVFTDPDGVQLPHEIEFYDNTTGSLVVWVKVPHLSSGEDATLYMYYGNPTTENQQDPASVWDPRYVAVHHLEEVNGTRLDSTGNGINATIDGIINKDVGKIDGADAFNRSGCEIIPQSSLPTSAITIELWLRPIYVSGVWTKFLNTGPKNTWGICGGQASLTSDLWEMILTWDNGTKAFRTGGQPSNSDWIYFVVTWDGNYARAYYNGLKIKETAINGTPDWINKSLFIGSNFNEGEQFKGTIDEIRLSDISRSEAWIQTSYENQKHLTKFYKIREEEKIPEAPVIHAPSPPDKVKNVPLNLTELSFNITDYQANLLNYTVITDPDIGSGNVTNVPSNRFTLNITKKLTPSTTYKWTVNATDGNHTTSVTFSFTTVPTEPPNQTEPILRIDENGNLICYNQTTTDPDGDRVTNIYNWYRNEKSITNLLLPFETNSSTTVIDYSGYNNNGIILEQVKWTDNGIVGGAYQFERGFIRIPGSDTLDGGGNWSEITVECWVNLPSYSSGTSRIIARIPSYEIGVSGNKIFASIWTATGNPKISGLNKITSNITIQTGTWNHIVLTYKKGENLTLYVNGTITAYLTALESPTLNYTVQPTGAETPLYVGWFDYFKGKIDEVRVYPTCLSQQQIQQRFNETKNGQSNNSTIVNEELKDGETWYCEVTPNDSHQDGTTKTSNTVTIGSNNKPIAKDLTITPLNPKTDQNLTASYTYFDPEGDPENTTQTEIRWYKNNQTVPELNNSLTVLYNFTTKGDVWYFTVKPSDGKEFGDTYESPHVLIQNSPPQIVNLTITPNPAYTNDTLTANLTAFDPDGDNVTVTYQWQKYNTTEGVWYNITGATNQTLGPENFNKTDQIKVICTPYDGEDYGIQQEANITISNSAPIISSYYPDYDPTINVTETQEFNVTCYDVDGDNLTIEWYVNGTSVLNQTDVCASSYTFNATESANTYVITVIVKDTESQTSHEWTLIVKEP